MRPKGNPRESARCRGVWRRPEAPVARVVVRDWSVALAQETQRGAHYDVCVIYPPYGVAVGISSTLPRALAPLLAEYATVILEGPAQGPVPTLDGIGVIEQLDTSAFKVHFGGEVKNFDRFSRYLGAYVPSLLAKLSTSTTASRGQTITTIRKGFSQQTDRAISYLPVRHRAFTKREFVPKTRELTLCCDTHQQCPTHRAA